MKAEQISGLLSITYLGQAGFIFESVNKKILIDPYLSNYVVESGIGSAELFSREFPAPLGADEINDVDCLFITHDHADHCDPLTVVPLVKANPSMRIICPQPVCTHLLEIGIPQNTILVPELGRNYAEEACKFYAIPAAHYGFDLDPEGRYSYFGYVIQIGSKTIYHAGDTILYNEMVEKILQHNISIDIACIPVNGRDGWRERLGMIGNLDGAEALELAQQIHADVLLPMHNDLFKVNHVNQAILADLIEKKTPRQKVHWLQPGEIYFN